MNVTAEIEDGFPRDGDMIYRRRIDDRLWRWMRRERGQKQERIAKEGAVEELLNETKIE